MSTSIGTKINQLIKDWPQNTVATSVWLHNYGVDKNLINRYVKSGWLVRVGNGAFIKPGDKLEWLAAVHAIQSQLKLEVHVGGETALELDGLYDQVPQANGQSVYIYGPKGLKLPQWFKNAKFKVLPVFSKIELFSKEPIQTYSEIKFSSYGVKVSSRERAILELLSDVPQKKDIASVFNLFHQLSTLRPKVVQSHLENCESVKVKRLFLYIARETHQPWLPEINRTKINLGKGKRVVVKGGRFDQEFQITVPEIVGG